MPKIQRSRWVLPDTIEPANTRCFLVEIPDEIHYIAAFKGALYNLTLWGNWQADDDHNGTLAAQRMLEAYASIQEVDCNMANLQFRACESGCGFEYSTDGVTWTCIDLTGCIETIWDEKLAQAFDDGFFGPGVGQSGPQEPPLAGTCRTYHVRQICGQMWHSPSPIRAGDTVRITNATGGWSVGELAWYCPDGSRFLLGICDDTLKTHVEGDLLNPDAYHMEVIGVVGGVYFNALDSLYVVPEGTELTDFYLLANTDATTEPSGEITYDVEVCSGGWTHVFDFRSGESAFWTPHVFDLHTYATYEAGIGYGVNYNLHAVALDTVDWPVDLNCTITIELDRVPSGPDPHCVASFGLTTLNEGWGATAEHTFVISDGSLLNWVDFDDDLADSGGNAYTWPGHLQRIIVQGLTGSDPF